MSEDERKLFWKSEDKYKFCDLLIFLNNCIQLSVCSYPHETLLEDIHGWLRMAIFNREQDFKYGNAWFKYLDGYEEGDLKYLFDCVFKHENIAEDDCRPTDDGDIPVDVVFVNSMQALIDSHDMSLYDEKRNDGVLIHLKKQIEETDVYSSKNITDREKLVRYKLAPLIQEVIFKTVILLETKEE